MNTKSHPEFWAILPVLLALLFTSTALSAPMKGQISKVRQPDGTEVELRLYGDEYSNFAETMDGYTVIRDQATKYLCYAELSPAKDNLLSTKIPVQKQYSGKKKLQKHLRISKERQTAKARKNRQKLSERKIQIAPAASPDSSITSSLSSPSGAPKAAGIKRVKGLCILVDFSDAPSTIFATEMNNFMNQQNYAGYGNHGSVRDYFSDVSDGKFIYENNVTTYYYRASHPKSYYADPEIQLGIRARELVTEAITDFEARNPTIDFGQFDSEGDGYIDAVNILYAGGVESDSGLWPHMWVLSDPGYVTHDGFIAYEYEISDIGSEPSVRVVCHENGHLVCDWPDLYDYDYDSSGVGDFCLMGYGGNDFNPVEPCAYLKQLMRWTNTITLTNAQVCNVIAGQNTIYKYNNSNDPNEFYLIENRNQQSGRDLFLPDSGLAIWHIDANMPNNDYNQRDPDRHFMVTLEQADGRWDLENYANYGDSEDLWKNPPKTECTGTSWWDDTLSGMGIYGIGIAGSSMTFTFAYQDVTPRVKIDGGGQYNSIQAAIADAIDGNTVLVNPGTYKESINLLGKEVYLRSSKIDDYPGDPNFYSDTTIISGEGFNQPVVTISGTNKQSTIKGFTITNGHAGFGGGISCTGNSIPHIANCIITANSADLCGGGIMVDQSTPYFENCTIKNNRAASNGGAVYISGLGSAATFKNCLIYDNNAMYGTAIGAMNLADLQIENCTVANNNVNVAANPDSAVIYASNSEITILNTIIWGNKSAMTFSLNDNAHVSASYSDIQGGWEGSENIKLDPLFVNETLRDYHLKSEQGHWTEIGWINDTITSPCINSGSPQSLFSIEPLPNGSRINMGAYGNTEQASKSDYGLEHRFDLNRDGTINLLDYAEFAKVWLNSGTYQYEDFNGSGQVDFDDLAALLDFWLWKQ